MDFDETKHVVLDELREVFDRIDKREIDRIADRIREANRVFLIGVGREGLSTRALAMRLMHLGHIHYVVEQAKKAGAKIAVVTGTPDRKTPALADDVLWIPACVFHGKDNVVPSVQPMGCLFEQSLLICFDLVVLKLIDEMELKSEEIVNRHRNVE